MSAERIEVVESEGNTLKYLDLVVQPFAEPVGLPVLPAVLDVTASVPYGTGCGVDFFHFGSCVLVIHSVRYSCFAVEPAFMKGNCCAPVIE